MLSLTQTYFLAHSSRQKLSKEAARPDHDLRLLVGHANMLDALMVDLASAEQEQERWFNKSVSGAKSEEEPTEEWAETIVEEPELEDAESSDDESEADEEEDTIITTAREVDSDDEFDSSELALTRTHSHSRHSPPELSSDSDSESDDEHMPPSPPQPTFSALTDKQRAAIATTSYYESKDASSLSPTEQEAFQQEGFFLPQRQQSTLIAAY